MTPTSLTCADGLTNRSVEPVAPAPDIVFPGDASPREVVAVLLALGLTGRIAAVGPVAAPGSTTGPGRASPRGRWADRTRALRGHAPVPRGRGAWRVPCLPR